MQKYFVGLPLLLSCTLTAQVSHPGLISGTVLDQQGRPVAGAKVLCHVMRPAAIGRAVPSAVTDQDGHFSIGNLKLGEYALNPKKENDGYPNNRFAFYSSTLFRVTLDAETPAVENVLLTLPAKAGAIQGSITDEFTGIPIAATVHMWRMDNPAAFLDASERGTFQVLIPSGAKIGLSVSSPGYQEWVYPGNSSYSSQLSAGPEEKITINIRLTPQPK